VDKTVNGLDGAIAEVAVEAVENRRCVLFREIDGYQKHRVKKLKKQQGLGG